MKKTLLISAITLGIFSIMGCSKTGYSPPTTWTKVDENEMFKYYMKFHTEVSDGVKGVPILLGVSKKSDYVKDNIQAGLLAIVKCEDQTALLMSLTGQNQLKKDLKENSDSSVLGILTPSKATLLKFACNIESKEKPTQPHPVQNQAISDTQQQDQLNQTNAAEQVQASSDSRTEVQQDAVSNTSDGWIHVNTRQGNYGNTNHAYVLPSSLSNNRIQVKEMIEGGQRNGSHYIYWMEVSCSNGMIRMASNVQQFDANNNFKGEKPPSSLGWYKATGQKDPAVWNYICRQ